MALARSRPSIAYPADALPARRLWQRLGDRAALVLAAALSLAAMALPVVQSSDAASTGYVIRQRQIELAALTARDEQLQAELAQLTSSERIRQRAISLGMVPAPQPAANITVTVPAPPARLTMPRAYLASTPVASASTELENATPAAAAPAQQHHGILWRILRALRLR